MSPSSSSRSSMVEQLEVSDPSSERHVDPSEAESEFDDAGDSGAP